jgi:hypothetical protein
MPPNLPTILGSAVPTIVVSSAARDIPSIRAIVTIIFAFLVIADLPIHFAYKEGKKEVIIF